MTQTANKSTSNKQSSVTTRTIDTRWYRNEVVFMGNLGRDPEMSYTPGGKAVTKFSLAVYQGKDKKSMWLHVTCWEKLAEEINGLAKKGTCVEVHGRLTQREYNDKYYHDVVADSIEVIERDRRGTKSNEVRPPDTTDDELDMHPF